jgi:fructose-bisphosphate aldolase, class I
MTRMADPRMMMQISGKPSFLAALGQSGGLTRGALRTYGIPNSA